MNSALFRTQRGPQVPRADTRNEAGGKAYTRTAEEALALYAATGMLDQTFYCDAGEQLDTALELARQCDPRFVAQAAIYARLHGRMKDMPALLAAYLWTLPMEHRWLAHCAFTNVVDNPRMLRTFVQIVRSGAVGRKSFGTGLRRMIRGYLEQRSDLQLFRQSIGQAPSLTDIIRMVHPRPHSDGRRALYGYLLGKDHSHEALPALVRAFEAWKRGDGPLPDVPFEMLTGLPLGLQEWKDVALRCSWTQARMNLNTFERHGVFKDQDVVDQLAVKLADPELVARAKAMPYQLLAAFKAAGTAPPRLRLALQDAMELATANAPGWRKHLAVCVDISGSMSSPLNRNSAVRVVDVAALFAATLLRKNPLAQVVPFDTDVRLIELNPRDSVMTNAGRLAQPGGGTACGVALDHLNRVGFKGDVVFISDNQSWADFQGWRGSSMASAWATMKGRHQDARLVCIDVQPYGTSQTRAGGDILHVGGFSDAVFHVVAAFLGERRSWVDIIRDMDLGPRPGAE